MTQYHLDIQCSATRHIPDLGPKVKCEIGFGHEPRIGDVVIGQVLKIGQHLVIENQHGQEILIQPGNICALVLGNRYSTREYYGEISGRLNQGDEFSLLNVGGIAGEVKESNMLARAPTKLIYLGHACGKDGERMNTFDYAPSELSSPPSGIPTILVVGTDMDCGKTTACGLVSRILAENGWHVGAGKLTGTSRMKDIFYMKACGAKWIADFMDLGFPSTSHCSLKELERIWDSIRSLLAQEDCQSLVLELADGVFQPETELILSSKKIQEEYSSLVLAADGSLSAFGAIEFLSDRYHMRPDFLSGIIVNSNLAVKEITSKADISVLNNLQASKKSFFEHIQRISHGGFNHSDNQG